MRLVRLARGFSLLGHRDQVRLAAAWSLLGLTRLVILALPFSVVRRLLGERRDPRVHLSPPQVSDDDLALATRIGTTVGLAARHTPWRSECYPQALTARVLLGVARIPHVVSFGVRRDGDALVAHAWVHAGSLTVTGGSGHNWTEVGSYSWTPRSRTGG